MPAINSDLKLSDETLGQLQAAMLESILTSSLLPGHSRPLGLADLPLVLGQQDIVVSSDNLGGPIRVQGMTRPIYILSEEAILQRAKHQGDFNYLRFQPPQISQFGVLLTLQICIAQRESSRPTLGLSGVQVTFHQSGTGWQAADETAGFAA